MAPAIAAMLLVDEDARWRDFDFGDLGALRVWFGEEVDVELVVCFVVCFVDEGMDGGCRLGDIVTLAGVRRL
jgi:hypothetical protein